MRDLDPYQRDLQQCGAEVIKTVDEKSRLEIHAKYRGRWADLQQKVNLEYRLIDEASSADAPTRLALRPRRSVDHE